MPERRAPTPSQTVGPFFSFALPFQGGANAGAEVGIGLRIEGQVIDGAGASMPDAILEMWHGAAFVRCATDAAGRYRVTIPKPRATPGPEGSTQAPHIEVSVFARGLLRHLATRIYFSDEQEANAADPILAGIDAARRTTLLAHHDGAVLRFDIRLQGGPETVFFAL